MEFKVKRLKDDDFSSAVRAVEVDGADVTDNSDIKTLQGAYREGLKEVNQLDAIQNRSEEQDQALMAALDGSEAVGKWIAQRGRVDDLKKLAKQGGGTPPLTGNEPGEARLSNMRPMVANEVDATRRIRERYGEGEFESEYVKNFASREYQDAFHALMRNANRVDSAAYRDASNTMQVGLDTAGGFQVPEDIYGMIIGRKPTPTSIQGLVTQVQTIRDSLAVPTFTYDPGGADPGVSSDQDIFTSPIRTTWTTEGSTTLDIGSAYRPSLGKDSIQIFTGMMRLYLTLEMLEDSAFPIMEFISTKFAEAIDVSKDEIIVSGDGHQQPKGLLVAPGTVNNPKVIPSAAQGLIDADTIKKVVWDLPPQYEDGARWIFNKKSFAYNLDTLKDLENRYLWSMGMQDNGIQQGYGNIRRPLLGYPVIFSALMPDIANGSYPAFFGDPSGYFLVNRIGFSIQVIREKYAEQGIVALLGRLRLGGQIVEPWKMRLYQVHS